MSSSWPPLIKKVFQKCSCLLSPLPFTENEWQWESRQVNLSQKLYVSLTCARCRVQQAKGIHMSPGYKLSRTSVVIAWPASTLLSQWWRDKFHLLLNDLNDIEPPPGIIEQVLSWDEDWSCCRGRCPTSMQTCPFVPLVKRQLSPCTKQFQSLHRTSRVTG